LGELKLELRMTQQTLWVYPAVEEVRQQLLQKLFAWQAIATSHPRIQSSRYQVWNMMRSNLIKELSTIWIISLILEID
jgi:hypothetical protein